MRSSGAAGEKIAAGAMGYLERGAERSCGGGKAKRRLLVHVRLTRRWAASRGLSWTLGFGSKGASPLSGAGVSLLVVGVAQTGESVRAD